MFASIAYPCVAEGCPAAMVQLHLRANGDVSPCDFTPYSFGSIRRQTLREIWESMAAAPVRAAFRPLPSFPPGFLGQAGRARPPVNPLSTTGAGERIVLTGATGFLGQQILAACCWNAARGASGALDARHRGAERGPASRRLLERCCGAEERAAARRRIEVFAADTAAERCGLSERDWTAAADGATRVIHAAASVRFDMTLEEARRVNVGGARNLLALAQEAGRRGTLRSFAT